MALTSSGTPLPSTATVFTIGGVHLSLRVARVCMARISRSTRSAPSRSLLLITNMSAISMMPALMVCTSSPMPGTRMTTVTSDRRTMSTSSWPTPTVSISTRSLPLASRMVATSVVARARPPRKPRGGHAADVDAGIGVMGLHADAIAQDGAAGVRAGGIDGDDADGALLLAVLAGELVDQRALAGAGSAGHPDHARLPAEGEHGFEDSNGFRPPVFNGADGPGQSAHIAGANALDPGLDGSVGQISPLTTVAR